jgi:phosphoglycolate phosphatase
MTSSFNLKEIRLVVFDWDGTLMDSTGAITSAIRDAAADLGLPVPSRTQASHVIGLALPIALRQAVPEVSPEQLPKLIERYKQHYMLRETSLHPFDGIPQLLESLEKMQVRTAIATGKSHIGLMRALDNLNWRSKFATTRCADQGHSKPHPWMLLDICSELGVRPDQALMIGDTTHDLGLAKNAGSPSVAVTYGAHGSDEFELFSPIAIFDEVAHLSSWLVAGLGAANESDDFEPAQIVGKSEDLEDRSYGLRFELPDGRQAFAIRFDGEVKAYVNQCRHLPTELDWNFGHFLDADKAFLVCATHGALYDPLTGVCVEGPCRGKVLEKVAIEEKHGNLQINLKPTVNR